MNTRRIIILLYVVLLTSFGLGASALFLDARAEYKALKLTETANQTALAAARTRLAEKERILQRMKQDPQYVERMIRDRLKYAHPTGEVIFRFEH